MRTIGLNPTIQPNSKGIEIFPIYKHSLTFFFNNHDTFILKIMWTIILTQFLSVEFMFAKRHGLSFDFSSYRPGEVTDRRSSILTSLNSFSKNNEEKIYYFTFQSGGYFSRYLTGSIFVLHPIFIAIHSKWMRRKIEIATVLLQISMTLDISSFYSIIPGHWTFCS